MVNNILNLEDNTVVRSIDKKKRVQKSDKPTNTGRAPGIKKEELYVLIEVEELKYLLEVMIGPIVLPRRWWYHEYVNIKAWYINYSPQLVIIIIVSYHYD